VTVVLTGTNRCSRPGRLPVAGLFPVGLSNLLCAISLNQQMLADFFRESPRWRVVLGAKSRQRRIGGSSALVLLLVDPDSIYEISGKSTTQPTVLIPFTLDPMQIPLNVVPFHHNRGSILLEPPCVSMQFAISHVVNFRKIITSFLQAAARVPKQ